jgi:hypothetical protein
MPSLDRALLAIAFPYDRRERHNFYLTFWNEEGNALPRHLTLTMEHRGNGSSAVLCCDDEENVIPHLFQILKGCVRWEISRIGDLDIDL